METKPLDVVLDTAALLRLAWEAADAAGDFLLTKRPRALRIDTKTSPTDPVTEMDQGAEQIIVSRVRKERPTDGFLGEEGSNEAGTSGIRWIIDPLDGTVNYIYGIPMWAVSIGVEIDGIVDLGVVMVPGQGEGFIGIRGHGAWHVTSGYATRMAPERSTALSMSLVGTGFGYVPAQRVQQTALLTALAPHIRDVRRFGACAVDLCWLALGRFDAYYEQGVHPWDYAAGAVIARESGCVVSGLDEDEPSNDMLLAAPEALHTELRSRMRSAIQSIGRSSAAYQ